MEVKEILSTVNMNTTIDFKKFDSTENQMELQSALLGLLKIFFRFMIY